MTSTGADRERFKALLAKGQVFEGKYRILGSIGAGSFAYVLRARHELMDRDVALKVLKPEIIESSPEVAARFLTEVKIVSKLRHPNTVTVFDFGTTDDGISYMVMEYVEGKSLEEVLHGGALDDKRVVNITRQVLKALDEAHAHSIVHRDLKPSNIMLTELHGEQDFVKVLDFGVAKLVSSQQPKKKSGFERRSTQFIGTPIYMSPEQVLGESVVPASDLYSLGLIVYEMLTGDPPLEAPNVAAVAQLHIDPAPLPFPKLPTLTPRFQKLIRRATARSLDQRFRSVTDFARQLPRIEDQDYSDEFKMLLGDERAEPPGADDEDDFLEMFSGKNYIAPPTEAEERRAERAPSRPLKPAPIARPEPVRPAVRSGRRDLAVDVGRIKRDEIRKERSSRDDGANNFRKGNLQRDAAWYVAGALSLFVSFLLASTVFVDSDGPGRVVIGLLPFGAAILGVQFSPVRRVGGTVSATYLVPLARYCCAAALVVFLIAALLFPESSASKLEIDGAWFVKSAPEESAVRQVVQGVSSIFASVFSFASRVLPW